VKSVVKGSGKKSKGSEEVAERPDAIEPFSRFEDLLEHWPAMLGRRFPDWLVRDMQRAETMRVEEFTDDDVRVIRVEAPGLDAEEDIEVSVANGQLMVSVTREEREESRDADGYRSEFQYGSFRRTMPLPVGVDPDDVSASYDDGILEVRVPIGEEARAKTQVHINKKS
jgi:HSP20 family protein